MQSRSSEREPQPSAHPPAPLARTDGVPDEMPQDGARKGAADRAFVVQFEPVEGPRSRLRGRAELVSSGEAIRFRSLTQLVDFLVGQLRRRHPHPDASPAASGPTRNPKRRQR